MPIPTKNPNEKETDFISRCMGNESMLKEYPDQKIRSGICFSQWRKDSDDPVTEASERQVRLDSFHKDKYQITNQGFLKAESLATKVGVFEYKHADGSVTREFRSPEEVFNQESMDSLKMVPITRNHPPGMVDIENLKQYGVGFTSDTIERRGDYVGCVAMITDKKEIDSILKKFDNMGMTDEVSLGYKCDVIPGVGDWNGETYDHIQKNIRYNHYSLLDGTGRAGRDVRLRLDEKTKEVVMKFRRKEIKVPGLHMDAMEIEIPDEATQTVEKLSGKLDEAVGIVDYLAKCGDTLQGRLDASAEEAKTLKKDLEDWQDPSSDKVQSMLKARKDLEDLAGKLKVEHKDKDDKALRLDIIKAVSKDFDPKDKSDEYIQARFDTIREAMEKTDTGDTSMAKFITTATELKADAGDPKDPRQDMIDRTQALYKEKPAEQAAAK